MDKEVEQEFAARASHEVLVEHVSKEFSSVYERDVANSDLIKMSVRAFSWEVNLNGFQFKKKVLKKQVVDAFKDKLPMYRTWEGKLVDKNHSMIDNGSKENIPIGYIESASMKEDGVYFDMFIWKRCLTDDEQRQIREFEVAVSMEVDFTHPVVIVKGVEMPATASNRKIKGAIRSMSDDSIVNGLGVAVLFDGILPGFASSDVVSTENAVLEDPTEPVDSTVPDISKRGNEAAQQVSNPEENEVKEKELTQELDAAKAELAAAKEQLESKQAELQKAFDDIALLRKQAFDECVAKNFDLDALGATTAAWLLDLLRWSSGSTEEVAANLVAIAGCVKSAGAAGGGTPVGEGTDDAAIQPTLPKPLYSSLEEQAAAEAAAALDPAAEVEAEEAPAAEVEAETPAAEVAAEVQIETEAVVATVTEDAAPEFVAANIAAGDKTGSFSGKPLWGIKHF